ncbi:MAG: aminoacyl-tRNA hydrolase [Ignavibacteria bacterium]|nr:aminoacyl-tRNA hydrolase [Ignavibacteria bacterium]
MKLIVGLGNPGINYETTRHNAGFFAVDSVLEFLNISLKPGKGNWYGAETEYKDELFYLMKPTTFMNRSGDAVLDFSEERNIPIKDILVVYDDFQLPLGMLRVRMKGSDGGHNGISSIIYSMNSLEFPRMRIGIGNENPVTVENYTDFVLSKFQADELEKLEILKPYLRDCILTFVTEGIYNAMNRYNRNFLAPSETEETDTEEN